MAPTYELAPQHDPDDFERNDGASEASRSSFSVSDLRVVPCCCLGCCFLAVFCLAEGVAWARQASCDSEAGDSSVSWNGVLPAETTTQMQLGLTTWLWHQVDVFKGNSTEGDMLGYWSNLDLFFGLLEKYAYVEEGRGTALEGWQPWGLYLGTRYHVWLCSSLKREYAIEEDYWARPWFFATQRIFNIRQLPGGQLVAKSQHTVQNLWSLQAYWTATVESPTGEKIATLRQDTPWNSWFYFFGYQKWWVESHRPDLLPHEVVSFLAAVYDIDKARDRKKKH